MRALNILHALNDGFDASIFLLLPFIAADLHLNLTQVGFLGTLVNSLGIIFALPAGYIAAKVGGLRTLTIALLLYGLCFLGTGFAPNYLSLFPLFILGGLGFAVFHPIGFALVAKLSDKVTRGRKMGNFTAIGDVGKIGISAILTFIIVAIGWRYTSLICALVIIVIGIIFSLRFLKRKEHPDAKAKELKQVKLFEIISNRKFIFAMLSRACDSFASSSLFIFLPFLLLKRAVDPALLGLFTATFFIGNFSGKIVLGRFVDKFGSAKVFIVSEVFMALFILLLVHATSFSLIIIYSIILGIFVKGTMPVVQTMVSEASEYHGNFEKAFGVNEFAAGIATTIAPVLLGFLSDKYGIVTAFNTMALVALLAIIPAFFFHLTKQAREF